MKFLKKNFSDLSLYGLIILYFSSSITSQSTIIGYTTRLEFNISIILSLGMFLLFRYLNDERDMSDAYNIQLKFIFVSMTLWNIVTYVITCYGIYLNYNN